MSRSKLSVVMIAKDEERFLRPCLESVQGVADEIVLVDTGSTDRTVEIAREFGAKISFHAWQDDFAAARNAALEQASGDWALWLDADERIAPGDGPLIRYLMENAQPEIGAYMVNIRNYMDFTDHPVVTWHRAVRLFRLLPGVRFTRRIHEQVLPSLEAQGFRAALCKATIDHYGYAAQVMEERDKHRRFIRMLTREVEETPTGDPFYGFQLFNLGTACFTAGEYADAIQWLEQAAERADTTQEYTQILFAEWAVALYLLDRPEETYRVYESARSLGVFHPALDFARGQAALQLERYEEAEMCFLQAIERGKSAQFVPMGDAGVFGYKAHFGIALSALNRHQWEKAAEACRNALAEKPDFLDGRTLLGQALRRMECFTEARAELEQARALAPGHAPVLEELGYALFALEDYAGAQEALRAASAKSGDPAQVWLHVGLCCEKQGRFAEARDAYLALRNLAPNSPEACVNLGRAHAALGENSEAIACFTEAIHLDPAYANAYFSAADALYSLRQYGQAMEILCAGLERDPENAAAFFVLGNCCFQSRDFAAACVAYEAALARRSDYPDALYNLALAREQAALAA